MGLVLLGAGLARRPRNGGAPWARLSWARGFCRLGFDVVVVDQLPAGACVNADGEPSPFEQSANVAYFDEIVGRFGLRGAVVLGDGEQVHGLGRGELLELAESATLLVNISGKVGWRELLQRVRLKVYVDTDPGFTQFSGLASSGDTSLAGHDAYFTVGANVGTKRGLVPAAGRRWQPVLPPVVLDDWPVVDGADPGRFTTVSTWRGRSFGSLEHKGRTFGLKADELLRMVELPRLLPYDFEIALNLWAPEPMPAAGDYPPRRAAELSREIDRLLRCGWRLVDPRAVAGDPFAYRRYVQASGAEFSVAKGIYVETASGWFSDRTATYLASGKPALVQDSGFGGALPVGEGLVAFRTLEEAVAGAERIVGDYESHSRAARSIAEQYLDSDRVLGRFVDALGISP